MKKRILILHIIIVSTTNFVVTEAFERLNAASLATSKERPRSRNHTVWGNRCNLPLPIRTSAG